MEGKSQKESGLAEIRSILAGDLGDLKITPDRGIKGGDAQWMVRMKDNDTH